MVVHSHDLDSVFIIGGSYTESVDYLEPEENIYQLQEDIFCEMYISDNCCQYDYKSAFQ